MGEKAVAEAGGQGKVEIYRPDMDPLTLLMVCTTPIVCEYSCRHCHAPIPYEKWCHLEVERMAKAGSYHKVVYDFNDERVRCAIL